MRKGTSKTNIKALRPCDGALYKLPGIEQKKKLMELKELWSERYKVQLSLAATLRRCIDLVYEEEFTQKGRKE